MIKLSPQAKRTDRQPFLNKKNPGKIFKWTIFLSFGWLALIYIGGYIVGHGSYKTRITLTIETPEGLKETSVVRKVSMNAQRNLFGVAPLLTETNGEALAIEIKPGQWLFGLVDGSNTPIHHSEADSYRPDQSGRASMMWYMTRWPGTGRDIITNPQTVYEQVPQDATRKEERAIASRNGYLRDTAPRSTYPGTLVTFSDINDPSTIKMVDLADLEATFGEGVRFVSGRYEFTKALRSDNRILSIVPWPQDQGLSVVPMEVRDQASAFAETAEGWKLYIDWNDFIKR